MKVIDLSVTLRKDNISLPPGHPDFELTEFRYQDEDFISLSILRMSTQTGSHVNMSYHFIKNGVTIDELPLEKIGGIADHIDLRKVSAPKKGISLEELKQGVGEREIKERIVILHSGWIKEKWGTQEMYQQNPYLMQESANWLVEQKIKSVGLDFSLDNPDKNNIPMEKRFPTHRTFLGSGIPHIENSCNFKRIDRDEFFFIALPLKLYKCNRAQARAIAILK